MVEFIPANGSDIYYPSSAVPFPPGGEVMKHLCYDCTGAGYSGEKRHPQIVMSELGITYEKAIPQSMGDQWWLFNCEHGELPGYITEMKCSARMVSQYKLPDKYLTSRYRIIIKGVTDAQILRRTQTLHYTKQPSTSRNMI